MTRNLVSEVDDAWFEMFLTHRDQAALKEAAGVDARGRKNTHPVLHFTLSWPRGEQPGKEHMQQTALSALKAIGLDEHQAVLAAHTDKQHAHVHVVVNTVHPLTGRTADQKFTKLAFSRWAEAYERQHGIHCEQRVANNADRDTMRILREYERGQGQEQGIYVPVKDRSPLRQEWLAQASDIRGREDPVNRILTALTRQNSTFTRQDLAREVNLLTTTAEQFAELMGRVEGSPELVHLAGTERLSTQTMVRAEAMLAATVDAMAQDASHPLDRNGLRLRAKADGLSPAQQAALTHITDAAAVSCLTGVAGAGKSFTLGMARQVWEAAGYTVRGAALSGIAAEGLAQSSGIPSSTLHALQWGLGNGTVTFTKRDVLVIDEAGMVGSRQMQQVISAARQGGAKVVLVGDPEQLQAIEAGAAYRAVSERCGAAALDEVRRQQVDWQRQATSDFASGNTAKALAAYAEHGHVVAHDTKDRAIAGLVAAWSTGLARNPSSPPDLILAATRRDVAALNTEARAAMRKAGRLGDDLEIDSVEEVFGKPEKRQRLALAPGDRLLFTKNDKRLGVRNGTLGTLESLDGASLLVRLDNGGRIAVDLGRYANVAHGYAMTIHKAQGVTVDRAHVLAGKSMDRHMAYVGLSRHRSEATLHYGRDDFTSEGAMMAKLSRQRLKDTTLDYAAARSFARSGRDAALSKAPPSEKKSERRPRQFKSKSRNRDDDFGLEL